MFRNVKYASPQLLKIGIRGTVNELFQSSVEMLIVVESQLGYDQLLIRGAEARDSQKKGCRRLDEPLLENVRQAFTELNVVVHFVLDGEQTVKSRGVSTTFHGYSIQHMPNEIVCTGIIR